jgi:Uma2 family endonuclease
MPDKLPRALVEINYYQAAQEYLRSLPLEHFMEATAQATQREITLESLALLKTLRSDVHVFNELLLQYPLPRRKRPGQVVPDNMVVVYAGEIKAEGSYDLPLQPVGPLWVLEYVSRNNKRKDYEDNMQKYERDLKVPYFLLFYPDDQELSLYHHNKRKYVSVKPNQQGRLALPELQLEMTLLDGWVRFWLRGDLLPLPGDLLRQRDDIQRERDDIQRERDEARQLLDASAAEVVRLRKELEQLRQSPGSKE